MAGVLLCPLAGERCYDRIGAATLAATPTLNRTMNAAARSVVTDDGFTNEKR